MHLTFHLLGKSHVQNSETKFKRRNEKKGTSCFFTLICDVYSPASSHVWLSMRVGAAQCLLSQLECVDIVRIVCFFLCQFWVSMLISMFSQVGPELVSFLISFCLGFCMLGTLQQFGKNDSMSLWISELGICRSWRIIVYIVPLIHATMIMSGSTIHPSWDKSAWKMAYLSSFRLVASTRDLSLQ